MKYDKEYYSYYKKLMRIGIGQPINETSEYKILSQHYPHLARCIALKREIHRLNEQFRSDKRIQKRLHVSRDIHILRVSLRKEQSTKKLRGESKIESVFRVILIRDTVREKILSFLVKNHDAVLTSYMKMCRMLRNLMRRTLPPSAFELRSLDVREKGEMLIEWVHKRNSHK